MKNKQKKKCKQYKHTVGIVYKSGRYIIREQLKVK